LRYLMRLLKVLCVIGAAVACASLVQRCGPWKTFGIWAAATGIACAGVGLILRSQPPEKVTIANYVAGLVLQWGYKVGRGKLPAIVGVSWAIWVLLGVPMILAVRASHGGGGGVLPFSHAEQTTATPQVRSAAMMVFLAIAWVIDGGALLWIIGLLATSTNTAHMMRSLGPVAAVLVAMIASSVALVTLTDSARAAWLALSIAAGPPLAIGGAYGLFILVILTVGRNARWN
jgi:hypothetical protein